MRRTVHVFHGQTPVRVGTIYHDAQGARESAAFEYATEWLASPDALALAPELRLVVGPQFRKRTESGSVFLGMSNAELDPFADAFEHEERDVVRKLK